MTGAIPIELGNLSKLEHLLLSNNQLTGCIPDELRDVPDNDFTSLNLPFCTDHPCITGGAVPDATNTGLISDCEALIVAGDVLAGTAATRLLNWAADTPIGQWYGVVLSGTQQRVTQLRLHGQNANADRGLPEAKLNGTMPPELGRLGELQVLYLHRNNLTGEVPGALNSLSKLRLLYLYDNGLTGISDELGPGMTELRRLFAQRNELNGDDTFRSGQYDQPGVVESLLQRPGRFHTAGVGQPTQPETALPSPERVDRHGAV